MKFPLDNKEVLSPNDTTVISKMKLRIYLFLGIMGYFVSFLTAYSPVVSDWLKSDQKKMMNKFEQDQKFEMFKDSIRMIEDLKIKKQNDENRDKIYYLMNEMRKEFPQSSQIVLYYTHDSGGVPVTGSPLNATILYTANNIEPCLGRNYWQSRVVPQGYVKMNKKIRDLSFLYIPNVGSDDDIYSDLETREDLLCNDIKSIMGIYLKETGYAVYYITINWNFTDPYMINFKSKMMLKRYASEILPLLQTKMKHEKI